MVDILLQPLGLFIIALGTGFLIPLFFRASRTSAVTSESRKLSASTFGASKI